MIASAYKIIKINYKNACKEIELMQQEKASFSILHPIFAATFKNNYWRKTNMKGPKMCGYQKRKFFL